MGADVTTAPGARRLASLDLLRGLSVALMILVNDPGDPDRIWPALDHAPWNGFTFADAVFPTFLYAMGCAIPFSVGRRLEAGEPRARLLREILRRGVLLVLIGWGIGLLAGWSYHRLRLFGVLPRLGLTYIACACLFLWVRSVRGVWIATVAILLGWWLILYLPVPGVGWPGRDVAFLDPRDNIASWCDRQLVAWTQAHLGTGRLYLGYRDPEGLPSTLPACASVLLGILAGLAFRRARRAGDEAPIAAWSRTLLPMLLVAAAIAPLLAVNKNLWTSSFVLLSAGIDGMLLYGLYRLVDRAGRPVRSRPVRAAMAFLAIFGANPLAAFIFSELVAIALWRFRWPATGWTTGQMIYAAVFARGGSSEATSAAFALAYVAFCFLPCLALWRRRIVISL